MGLGIICWDLFIMRTILTYILLVFYTLSYSQNMVTNGNFEKYSNCPFAQDQLKCVLYWWQFQLYSHRFDQSPGGL